MPDIRTVRENEIGTNAYPDQTLTPGGRIVRELGDRYGRSRVAQDMRQISSPAVWVQSSAFSTPVPLGYTYYSGTDGKITPQSATTGLLTSASGASNYTNVMVGQNVVLSASVTSENATDGAITNSGGVSTFTSASMTYANVQVGQTISITDVNIPGSGSDAAITQSGSTTTVTSATIPFATAQVGQKILIGGGFNGTNGTDLVIGAHEGNGSVKLTAASLVTLGYSNISVGQNIVISSATHSANNGTFPVVAVGASYIAINHPQAVSGDTGVTYSLQGNNGTYTITSVSTTGGGSLTYTNANGHTHALPNKMWVLYGNNGTYTITAVNSGNVQFAAPYGIAATGLTWTLNGNNGTWKVLSTSSAGVLLSMASPTLEAPTTGAIHWNTLDTGYTDLKITAFSTPTCTATSATIDLTKLAVGDLINITTATNAGNKGIFVITQVGTSSFQFSNTAGVVETSGTSMTFSISLPYVTVSSLIQSVTQPTSPSYNVPYFAEIHSQANGGTLTFQTTDSSVAQTETLVGGSRYPYQITKIYINTTANGSLSSVTDLVGLVAGTY